MNVGLDERRKIFFSNARANMNKLEEVKNSRDPLRDYVSSHENTTGRAFRAIV